MTDKKADHQVLLFRKIGHTILSNFYSWFYILSFIYKITIYFHVKYDFIINEINYSIQ